MPLADLTLDPRLADSLLALAAYEPFPTRRASMAALARHASGGDVEALLREGDNYFAMTEHATTQDTGVAALRGLVLAGLYHAARDVIEARAVGRELSASAANYAAVLAQRGGERFTVDRASAAEGLVAALRRGPTP